MPASCHAASQRFSASALSKCLASAFESTVGKVLSFVIGDPRGAMYVAKKEARGKPARWSAAARQNPGKKPRLAIRGSSSRPNQSAPALDHRAAFPLLARVLLQRIERARRARPPRTFGATAAAT